MMKKQTETKKIENIISMSMKELVPSITDQLTKKMSIIIKTTIDQVVSGIKEENRKLCLLT